MANCSLEERVRPAPRRSLPPQTINNIRHNDIITQTLPQSENGNYFTTLLTSNSVQEHEVLEVGDFTTLPLLRHVGVPHQLPRGHHRRASATVQLCDRSGRNRRLRSCAHLIHCTSISTVKCTQTATKHNRTANN